MLSFLSFKKKELFALDVGSHSIKLVQLKSTKKGFHLMKVGRALLPSDAIVDGAMMDASAIVEAIQGLVSSSKIKVKDVSTSVSGNAVIIRKITLAAMTEDELAESIQWEAEQYIPFDIADVNLDFQILGPDPADESQMEVLLVAAKKEVVDDYNAVLAEAGLNPVVLDVDAFACQNMLEVNYTFEEDEIVAVVNIGAAISNINIVRNGISLFTRDVASGGNQFTEEIQKRFGVSHEDAEAAKLGKQMEGVDVEEMNSIISSALDSLSSEIARTIDFFLATNPDVTIGKVYVCGGVAGTHGLEGVLSEKLSVSVVIANPFNAISFNEKSVDSDCVSTLASSFGVAVGLAIRVVGD